MAKIEEFTFQVAEIKFKKDGFHIVRTTQGVSVSGKFAAQEGYCYKSEGVLGDSSHLRAAVQAH